MIRSDEVRVPRGIGDAPPALPFRKPFDLSPWQLLGAIVSFVIAINVDATGLSDVPIHENSPITPLLASRFFVLLLGGCFVFLRPNGRSLPMLMFVSVRHFWRASAAVYFSGDERGPTYYDVDADQITYMKLQGESTMFVVDPPFWWLFRRTPMAQTYWEKHVPYRMLLPVESEGDLMLMTDDERAARAAAFCAGIKALSHPVQVVAQARPEDVEWVAERAMPPAFSPFASLGISIGRWARERALTLMRRRIVVACSAPSESALIEHVRDVAGALTDSGLTVREMDRLEQQSLFDSIYGNKKFYPHSSDSFGIDGEDWVTLVVRHFPGNVVIGWIMFVIGSLPVDVSIYAEPDDAVWIVKIMEWFEGMCEMPTADTQHKDTLADLQYVEGKLKRTEDCVMRVTMLLTMPKKHVARVKNRLRKSGAIFREATNEHQEGRFASLPKGGLPEVGATRPLDGMSFAACFPFGAAGLPMKKGALLGRSKNGREAVVLDLLAAAFTASMVAILGVTGAGKTFLMQLLIARSGLPFTIIDMKPHLDERHYGDFFRFTLEAKGQYDVVTTASLALAEELDEFGDMVGFTNQHPFAQCYNLASLSHADRARALYLIAESEWKRAASTLDDRIFAVDEVNILGATDAGKEFIERVASQGRSMGFIGIFASQEVEDFLRDRRLAKAVTQASMLFVLAQAPGSADYVCSTLKLSDTVAQEVVKFQPDPNDDSAATARYAILRAGRRVVSFQIEASPEELRLFTTKPADKRAMLAEKELVTA